MYSSQPNDFFRRERGIIFAAAGARKALAGQGRAGGQPRQSPLYEVAHHHAEHLAPAIAVHADRNGDLDRNDAFSLTNFQVVSTDPYVRSVALDKPFKKRRLADVGLLAKSAYLNLRGAAHRNGHQIIGRMRTRFLGCTPPRQPQSAHSRKSGRAPGGLEGWKVVARPQLGNGFWPS